jgi:RNA polymerase-binding transcription factor DksA
MAARPGRVQESMTDREAGGGRSAARARLAAAREAAEARLRALTRDFDGIVGSAAGDDEHDPEGATNAFERQHVAALIDQARRQLADIDAALGRLDGAGYGTCERCGRPIGAARLAARPAARTCITCAAAERP